MKNLTAAVLLAGVTFVSLSNAGSVAPANPESASVDHRMPSAAAPAGDHQRFDHAR